MKSIRKKPTSALLVQQFLRDVEGVQNATYASVSPESTAIAKVLLVSIGQLEEAGEAMPGRIALLEKDLQEFKVSRFECTYGGGDR